MNQWRKLGLKLNLRTGSRVYIDGRFHVVVEASRDSAGAVALRCVPLGDRPLGNVFRMPVGLLGCFVAAGEAVVLNGGAACPRPVGRLANGAPTGPSKGARSNRLTPPPAGRSSRLPSGRHAAFASTRGVRR